jgi:hypothetical protein
VSASAFCLPERYRNVSYQQTVSIGADTLQFPL